MPHIVILGKSAGTELALNTQQSNEYYESRRCSKCNREVDIYLPRDVAERTVTLKHIENAYRSIDSGQSCGAHDNGVVYVTVGI